MKYKETELVEWARRKCVIVAIEHGSYHVAELGTPLVHHVGEEQISKWEDKVLFHVPEVTLCRGCPQYDNGQSDCHRCILHRKFIDLFETMEIPKL